MSGIFHFDDSWDKNLTSNYKLLSERIFNLFIKFYGRNELKIVDRKIVYRADNNPQTSEDRKTIFISAGDPYQFVFQFSHELCHCFTSDHNLPKNIRWFDEFLSCFSSYFVLKKLISQRNDKTLRKIFGDKYIILLSQYVAKIISKNEEDEKIVSCDSTVKLFIKHKNNYSQDEDLIKQHDVYYLRFFDMLERDYNGLSFIGKMHMVNTETVTDIVSYLEQLKKLCDKDEIATINMICDIFGISLAQEGQVA